MDMLRILLIAACAIEVVNPLPQPLSDWSLFDSSDQPAYDTSAFLSADAPSDSNVFPYNSNLATGPQTNDWASYDLVSLPSESGAGDDILWDDSNYSSAFDIAATGCSGVLSKRGDGDAMCSPAEKAQGVQEQAPAQEQDPCDPDKEPQCCIPSWMFRSRWPGGGHNMDGCSEYITADSCLKIGGSVQCCTKQAVNLLNTVRHGCSTSKKVAGNVEPNAPPPQIPEELPPVPQEPIPVPGDVPLAPELTPYNGGF